MRQRGVFDWSNAKVCKLCRDGNFTIWELSAMIGILKRDGELDREKIRTHWARGYWPPSLGIHLSNIRDFVDLRKDVCG